MIQNLKIWFASKLVGMTGWLAGESFEYAINQLAKEKALLIAVSHIREFYVTQGINICSNGKCITTKPLLKHESNYYCEPHKNQQIQLESLKNRGTNSKIKEI